MARILIAEDEPDILALIEFTLKFGGHEVFAFSNGGDAVEQAPGLMPDLVLLDVRMPRLTGYEACQMLKKDARTKDIPVVFLSAKGQEAEVDEGMAAGAVAYILKPFSPDHLLNDLKKFLAEHVSGQPAVTSEPEVESSPEAEKKPDTAAASPAEADVKKPEATGPPAAASPKEPDTKKPDGDDPTVISEPAAASPKDSEKKPGSDSPTTKSPDS